MICALSISLANISMDSPIFSGFRFLNTTVLTIPPASSKALPTSYSQFVPGNTGTNTRGLVIGILRVIVHDLSLIIFFAFLFSALTFVGNTFSNGFSHILINSSKEKDTSQLTTIFSSAVVVPRTFAFSTSTPSFNSIMKEP